MSGLFDSPVLKFAGPTVDLEYRIEDEEKTVVARVTQIGGVRKTGIQRFINTNRKPRVVLQVADPGGTPLFIIDRAEVPPKYYGPQQPPCALVAPNGGLIGRIEHDIRALGGIFTGTGAVYRYHMYDPMGRWLCEMNQQPIGVSRFTNDTYRTGGHYCTYTDANNTEIARLDFAYWWLRGPRATLRFAYALPDPLRTLIIASPITMDLMQSAL